MTLTQSSAPYVGPATAHRRPHAIQLLGRLFPTDLPSPAGPTFRLSATELLPFRERVQDGIGMPGAMAAVARPGILARIGHHRGPHRVGLDVPQNDEQVVAVLDDRKRPCQTWPLVPCRRWCRQV